MMSRRSPAVALAKFPQRLRLLPPSVTLRDLYAEQFFRVSERNFFLGFTGQIHCPKPVGLLLHVCKRVIGCKHHPIYTDVLQQKMKQVTPGECAGCDPEIVSEVLPDRLF